MLKSVLYAKILMAFVIIGSAVSYILCMLSQDFLRENLQTGQISVIQFGDIRFTFTICVFVGVAVLTCYYITLWRASKTHPTDNSYNKTELILLTVLSLMTVACNYFTLNVSWQFCFVSVMIIIYEVITLIKSSV